MHGTKWTYLSTVVSFVMQLVLTAILARLLAPAAFGLIAMAWLVLRFGQYFAQMGIGQAIVQRQEISRAHIAAGFWSSVAVGAVFSLAVWVAAPLASVLFESPQLVPVLRAMGLTFALSGTSAAAGALLRRQMRFRGMAIADMAAYAAGYGVVGVTLALSGWGVWSLVAASLGQAAVVTVAYNALARPSVVPVLNWRPYRDLLGFGSLVSVISFLEFVNANLDTLAVGRIAGPTSLGYYSRALSLTGLPLVYMGTSLSRVLFPSFSKIQAETARLGRAYLSVITVFAGVGLPIALGGIVARPMARPAGANRSRGPMRNWYAGVSDHVPIRGQRGCRSSPGCKDSGCGAVALCRPHARLGHGRRGEEGQNIRVISLEIVGVPKGCSLARAARRLLAHRAMGLEQSGLTVHRHRTIERPAAWNCPEPEPF